MLHLLSMKLNIFFNNSASDSGGAIFADSNTLLSFTGTNEFSHNSAHYGGAIYAETNISLTFSGTNEFSHNSAEHLWWCNCHS